MKKCIFSWFGFVMPLQERLTLIKKNNFDATCLWWEDEYYPESIPVDDMPVMVRKAGLDLDNIHCPYSDVNYLWSIDKRELEKTMQTYLKYVDSCNYHRIPVMVMHATNKNFVNKNLTIGISAFKELVKYAENKNVKIAIENTRDFEIIDTLLTNIESSHFGLCYDSSHDWIAEQSRGDLVKKWKHRLFATHLSDNDMIDDKHWIPGDGMVIWENIIPSILDSNLSCVTLELMSSKEKISDPDLFLSLAYKRLVNYLK
ncbi:MAG: sugar phosphate isomerase/epimerase family protein [Eubacteriaceae bacterium]